MRFIIITVILSFLCCHSTEFNTYCQTDENPILKFEGTGNDFYMKVKTIKDLDDSLVEQICSEIGKLEHISGTSRGSDYSISFMFKNDNKYNIEMYYYPESVTKYLFWIGLKFYKNDSLAHIFTQTLNVDEIKSNDDYKIDEW